MIVRKTFWLSLLVALAMVLAACGGGGEEADTGDNGGDGADVSNVSLSETETLSIQGFTLTVNYPTGWAAEGNEESAGISVASSEELLGALSGDEVPEFGEGQVAMLVQALPTEAAGALVQEGEVNASAIATTFAELFSGIVGETEGVTVGDVVESEVNGQPSARVDFTAEEGDISIEGAVQVVTVDAGFIIVVGLGEVGAEFDAIVGSIEFTAAAE